MEIQWLGHSAVRLEAAGKNLLIDPYLSANPLAPPGAVEALQDIDLILASHGHDDHVGDTVDLAGRHGAQVVAIAEICSWLGAQGVENCLSMNIGGTATLDGLSISMVRAVHSSSTRRDGMPIYLGECTGFVIKAEGQAVYHAGDTDVFSDMALIQKIHAPTVGLLPIGGHFTMSPETAALACNEFLELDIVVPMHFATFPVLAPDASEFSAAVKRGRVEVLSPGGSLTL